MECKLCGSTLSDSSEVCTPCRSKLVVRTSPEDMLYYQIVRATIQGIDNLRIATVVAGLTFNFALLTAAAFVWQNIKAVEIVEHKVPIGCIAAILFSIVAGILNHPFLKKIEMFNKFMEQGVRIAGKLEEISISRDDLRLTNSFQASHRNAGQHGDFIFEVALKVMRVISYLSGGFFLWRFVEDLVKG